jgi:hypothetical protein
MKPGNQQAHGANTCEFFAMMGFYVDHEPRRTAGFFYGVR